MQRFKALFQKSGFHAFIAYLVMLLFSWPLLTLFGDVRSGALFIYFFALWGLVIVFLLLIAITHRDMKSEPPETSEPEV
mgnify:CR=1 FL=1